MADSVEIISKVAEQGGAVVAVSSAVIGFSSSAMGWLNHNSAGVLALCGIGGLLISYFGYRSSQSHRAKLLELEVRQKTRRTHEQVFE